MTIEKMLILIISIIAVSGCISNRNEHIEFTLEPPGDEFYSAGFERAVNRLGLYRSKSADGVDQALVVINASFDGMIGISLLRDIVDEDDDQFESYTLAVAVWEHSKDALRQKDEIRELKSVIKSYYTEVTSSDVERVAKRLEESRFYKEAFTDKPDSFCADGITYFIEARFNENHNVIGRHSCDNGYASTILAVDLLFDLAISEFPMVSERLIKSENAILESQALYSGH